VKTSPDRVRPVSFSACEVLHVNHKHGHSEGDLLNPETSIILQKCASAIDPY